MICAWVGGGMGGVCVVIQMFSGVVDRWVGVMVSIVVLVAQWI